MFRLSLFRIRAFTFGTLSTFLSAVARGGLMFMLVIWLQGVWLPQHGYDFTETPLWAGIYMLPLTLGMLLVGPASGYLSDRFGARPFATAGMVLTALGFGLLMLLPTNFAYPRSAAILLLIGASMGLFASPNRAAVMNSLPPRAPRRGRGDEPDVPELGAGAVDRHLLHADDPRACPRRCRTRWPPACRPTASRPDGRTRSASCRRSRSCSPPSWATTRSSTSSARTCSARCPRTARRRSPGRTFFPTLISAPFRHGLHAAFAFAMVACLVAAAASAMRGGRTCPPRVLVAKEQHAA